MDNINILEFQFELSNGDWETNNWIGVYLSVEDPESPGTY